MTRHIVPSAVFRPGSMRPIAAPPELAGSLPTFLVIGAQKAATTTLWAWLRTHPDVFMPDVKEPGYFIDAAGWSLGLPWYASLFEPGRDRPHRGEASPGYTMAPFFSEAPGRIADLLPDVRLVYVVRDPVDRMRSAYAQACADGSERRPLAEALLHGTRYLAPSLYGYQLARFAAQHDAGQVLVLRAEDVATTPGTAIDALLAHLDLPLGWRPLDEAGRTNTSDEKRVVRRQLRWLQPRVANRSTQARGRALAAADNPVGRVLGRPLSTDEREVPRHVVELLVELIAPDAERFRARTGVDPWGSSVGR